MIVITSLKHPVINNKLKTALKNAIDSFNNDPSKGGYSEVRNRNGQSFLYIIYDGRSVEACDSRGNDVTETVMRAVKVQ